MSRRGCKDNLSVSLFPFLAVLICTMGALIVLLVVFMQQASKSATAAPLPPPLELAREEQQRTELEQRQQDLEWQAKILAESRVETMRRLREQQTELSMFEDQARKLKDQLDHLFEESQQLDRLNNDQTSSHEDVLRSKSEVDQQVVRAKFELEQLKTKQKQSENRFAIVPYDGPRGTKRRPIFVECLGSSIVIQPEGVRLVPEDFPLPLDNNNVLALALRAIREYWVNVGLVRTSQEPYPLLIVRPHGEDAFSICRHALQDWDDDFGYELLPEEIELTYPKPDANLKDLLERTIDEARWRQNQRLARRPQGIVLSTTSRQGGFVREGQPGVGRAASKIPAGNPFAGMQPPGRTGPQTRRPTSGNFEPSQPNTFASTFRPASGTGEDMARGAGKEMARRTADGAARSTGKGAAKGTAASTTRSTGEGTATSTGAGTASGAGQRGANRESHSTAAAGGIWPSMDAQPSAPTGAPPGSQSAGAAPGAMGMQNGQSAAPPDGAAAAATQMGMCTARPMASVAQTQGANWALPGVATGAIGIQRPLTVRCRGDFLELLPEPGSRQVTVSIPLRAGMEVAVKDLVSAVWNRIHSWGIAGTGTYWKPVIEAEVNVDGEARYLELSQLMDDSGIAVTRK